jgi:hypothetical protein
LRIHDHPSEFNALNEILSILHNLAKFTITALPLYFYLIANRQDKSTVVCFLAINGAYKYLRLRPLWRIGPLLSPSITHHALTNTRTKLLADLAFGSRIHTFMTTKMGSVALSLKDHRDLLNISD